jgi:hypothetical protein
MSRIAGDPIVNLYSTNLANYAKMSKANPMTAVQRLYETMEETKLKKEIIQQARFHYEHPFRPNLKPGTLNNGYQ